MKLDLIEAIRERYRLLAPVLNERERRLWAAAEVRALGRGGQEAVFRATGIAKTTLIRGQEDLDRLQHSPPTQKPQEQRIRREGGGRPPLEETDPTLLKDLDALVHPLTRGDPESPLRWTCKSTRVLAAELKAQGHRISANTVATLLREQGYSLQGNRKTQEGQQHPDRNEQFEYIASRTAIHLEQQEPAISVDTKKKELVGEFKNGGREWQPQGEPIEVNTHDFPDPELGKAIPYGIYDIAANQGWVNVGTDHDTSEFAVQSIRNWWKGMGQEQYPKARKLLITADGGGSNGSRSRLWKVELQALANETGLVIEVCHFPPGTSKWNQIEHQLFSAISRNWRGQPLISHEVIVGLIGATTTRKGLKVHAELDLREYPTGIKVSDEEMREVWLKPSDWHGEWNYFIWPESHPKRSVYF